MIKELVSRLGSSKQIRNGGLFSLYSFFNRGIAFVLLILLAEYITPEQYGELSIFNTITILFGYFVGMSTAGYISVSYFKNNPEDFKKDFSTICSITIICSLIIFIALSIFRNLIEIWLTIPFTFLYISIFISFTSTILNINLDYIRIQEDVGKYGILSCSFAVLNFVLSLYLVIIINLNWQGRVYAQLVCDIIYAGIAIYMFTKSKLIVFTLKWDRYRRILLWGLPIIPHLASSWIKQGLDRFIIEKTHTMADVGLFSFALNLSSIILIVGTAFNQVNSIDLYKILSSELCNNDKICVLKKKERLFLLLYFIVSSIILVGGLIFIPLALPTYIKSLPYFIILVFFALFQCIYLIYCNYLFYFNKTNKLMYITLSSSMLHLILSLLLTKYSLYYTSVIYVVSQFILCIFVYKQSRKLINQLI